MITVKIWNPEKLAMYYRGDYPCNTPEAINEYEDKEGFVLSSEIQANNIEHLKEVLTAIYNETDCLLCFYLLDEVI